MRRIGLNDAFRMLVEKAGRMPETAVRDLYDEASRNDSKLHLWCGDGKDPLPRDYIRDCLRFELGDNAIKVFGPIGLSSGRRLDHLFPYYVDADQVEALIAELTKPKRKRAERKESELKVWAKGQLRGLIKAGDLKPQQTLLRRWPKKYGRIRDRAARERLQRNLLRWRNEVIKEIAA
jgi:hypothetical protein